MLNWGKILIMLSSARVTPHLPADTGAVPIVEPSASVRVTVPVGAVPAASQQRPNVEAELNSCLHCNLDWAKRSAAQPQTKWSAAAHCCSPGYANDVVVR